jgi:hypothetical protein
MQERKRKMRNLHSIVRRGLRVLAGFGITALAACGGGGDAALTATAAPEAEMPSAHALAKSGTSSASVVTYRGRVAIADFLERSADGCTWTYAQIVAGAFLAPGNGSQSVGKDLNVYGFIYDECNGTYDLFAGGGDPHEKVFIKESGATASGAFMVEFPGGAIKKVEINLSWNGGVARTDNTRTINIGPEVKVISRTTSSFKFADSVTGSIVIDGDDHLSSSHTSGVSGYTVQNGETTIQVVRQL